MFQAKRTSIGLWYPTPTVSLVRMTIWRQGLEAAKVRAEELLHSIVQIERDAVLQPQGDG